MKKLIEMTQAEYLDCQGMWCEVDTKSTKSTETEDHLAIIVRLYPLVDARTVQIFVPETNDYYLIGIGAVTPRFDLPRAWQPNGQPNL